MFHDYLFMSFSLVSSVLLKRYISYKQQADINQVEHRHHSALWIASVRGRTECVNALLKHKDIIIDNVDMTQVSPLWAACQNNHHEVAELLLNPPSGQQGANPNLPKQDGCTPIWISAARGSLECIKVLIKYGAFVNKEDTSSGIFYIFSIFRNMSKIK